MGKTAGMVSGIPAWQRDRMFETETAEDLEQIYSDEDFPVSSIADEFGTAKYYIGQAVRHIIRAANEAEKYGRNKPIDELIEALDDEYCDRMDSVLRKLKEGA